MSGSSKQDEFMNLFRQCERPLLAYLLTMVPRHADAMDLLQETAAALWNKFDQYDRSLPFVAWARKFAHMQVHKHREQERYRDWMLAPFNDRLIELLAIEVEGHTGVVELRTEALVECLKELTQAEHDLLHERYWKQTNLRKLAAERGASEQQLYRRLFATRRLLHACIDRRMAEKGAS